jgi:hypothetical protein
LNSPHANEAPPPYSCWWQNTPRSPFLQFLQTLPAAVFAGHDFWAGPRGRKSEQRLSSRSQSESDSELGDGDDDAEDEGDSDGDDGNDGDGDDDGDDGDDGALPSSKPPTPLSIVSPL